MSILFFRSDWSHQIMKAGAKLGGMDCPPSVTDGWKPTVLVYSSRCLSSDHMPRTTEIHIFTGKFVGVSLVHTVPCWYLLIILFKKYLTEVLRYKSSHYNQCSRVCNMQYSNINHRLVIIIKKHIIEILYEKPSHLHVTDSVRQVCDARSTS